MFRAFHWSLIIAAVLVALVCCASCRDADRARPTNSQTGSQPNQDWELLNDKAVELHAVGKYSAAVEAATVAIDIEPTHHLAYFNRAWSLRQMGNNDDAIDDLTTAIKLNPTPDGEYYMMRGMAWHSKRNFDRALKDFGKAIEIDPNSSMTYCLRAETIVQMGNFEDALLDYNRSIRLDSSNDLAHDRLAWLLSTCPDDAIRDGAVALEHAQQANELREWIDYLYWDSLAAAYAETGQFEKAVEWIEKALVKSPPQDQAELKLQLKSYKAKQPFRDDSDLCANKWPE